jgi:FXSXX-COOH protein
MTNNVADGVLLDVRGISLADLDSTDMGSTALDAALNRVISADSGCHFQSFNSSI